MKKERIFAMDFVRTIATLIIIIFHFNISVGTRGISTFTILKNDFVNINLAHVGVPIFFVLSGFALMFSNERQYSIITFYKKRFKAVYPMFWLSYLLVTVYYFLVYRSICPWIERPSKISFLLTVVGLDGYTTPLMVNWYKVGEWFLGCIIIIYLIFPILKAGINRFPKVFWIPWFLIYLYLTFNYDSLIPQTQNVLLRLPEFLLGMYLCKYRSKINEKSAIFSFVIALIILLVPLSFIPTMFLVTIMGGTCYIFLYWLGGKINNSAIQKPFIWFSKYSFAIYLLHHVISEQIIHRFAGFSISNVEVMFLFIVVLIFDILGGYGLLHLTDFVLQKMSEWFALWRKKEC